MNKKQQHRLADDLNVWYVHIVHHYAGDSTKKHHISVGPYYKSEINSVVKQTRMTHRILHQFKSPYIICNIFFGTDPDVERTLERKNK